MTIEWIIQEFRREINFSTGDNKNITAMCKNQPFLELGDFFKTFCNQKPIIIKQLEAITFFSHPRGFISIFLAVKTYLYNHISPKLHC